MRDERRVLKKELKDTEASLAKAKKDVVAAEERGYAAAIAEEKIRAKSTLQLAIDKERLKLQEAESSKKVAIEKERENRRKAAEGWILKYQKQKQQFSKVLEQVKEYSEVLLDCKQCMLETVLERKEVECRERVGMAEKRRGDALERSRLNREVVFSGLENRINSIKNSLSDKQITLSESVDENKHKLVEEKAIHRATKKKLGNTSSTAASRLSRERTLKDQFDDLCDEYLDKKKNGKVSSQLCRVFVLNRRKM